MSYARSRMGSKSPGNTSQPPAFFSKLTESNSAMVKSKKQEINKKLNTHNRNEPEYSKGPSVGLGAGVVAETHGVLSETWWIPATAAVTLHPTLEEPQGGLCLCCRHWH